MNERIWIMFETFFAKLIEVEKVLSHVGLRFAFHVGVEGARVL